MTMIRFPLILKISLLLIGFGVLFTVASLFVFDRMLSSRVLSGVGRELVSSQGIVRQFLEQEREFLHAVAMSHGEMIGSLNPEPDSLYYVTWGQHHLRHTKIDLIQLEDTETGEIIARIIRDFPDVEETPAFSRMEPLQFYHDAQYLYSIESFSIPNTSHKLYVGKRIDSEWVWGLTNTTHSRMAVFTGSEFLAVSVDSSMLAPLRASLPWDMSAQNNPYEMLIGDSRMMVMCEGLPGSNSPQLCVLLLRDLEPELAVLMDVRESISVLAFFILFLTIAVGIIAAWGIVRRIRELVRASEAMKQGNDSYPLSAFGRDELGQLTGRFIEMRNRLRERHEELLSLNKQLRTQMDALSRTQRQLVQSEKLATMGRLTAQLSHELNNPICNIQNCIEVLNKHYCKGGESEEYVALIRDEVRRMSKLTRQLLDFHRPSKSDFEATDVNELIDSILRISRQQLDRKRITVEQSLYPALPHVIGNADQLKQVILNLVLNAADAMENGGTLTITSKQDDDYVVLHVSDTGIGMDEETRDRIFDAFFTTKREVAGVGLGLSVSYSIIRQHGGWINVESEPGKGTRFQIRLPLAAAHVQESEIVS
jgi:signal transduction histidine kinase